MPYNAPSALKIVPETGEVVEVGNFGSGGWKWHGGLRSGQYIIAIPSHANFVLRIDPSTDDVRLFPTGLVGGCYKWAGGVADCNGNVWTVPGDSAYTLKIVPSSGEVTVIGGLPHTKNKWQNGVCGRDGNVYCIPCDSSQVLCIHTRTGELSLHGDLGALKHKFQGVPRSGEYSPCTPHLRDQWSSAPATPPPLADAVRRMCCRTIHARLPMRAQGRTRRRMASSGLFQRTATMSCAWCRRSTTTRRHLGCARGVPISASVRLQEGSSAAASCGS